MAYNGLLYYTLLYLSMLCHGILYCIELYYIRLILYYIRLYCSIIVLYVFVYMYATYCIHIHTVISENLNLCLKFYWTLDLICICQNYWYSNFYWPLWSCPLGPLILINCCHNKRYQGSILHDTKDRCLSMVWFGRSLGFSSRTPGTVKNQPYLYVLCSWVFLGYIEQWKKGP